MHVQVNIALKPSINYVTKDLIPFFTNFTLLFMIVSGFSLCCGYYTRIKEGTITPNAFYRKRYLRILPFFALLCLIDLAVESGIMEKSGAWYSYNGEKLGQGKENVKSLFRENKKLCAEIEAKVRDHYNKKVSAS